MEVINLNKKIYAKDYTDVVAEIYRDKELVVSKKFNCLSESFFEMFKSDETRRENNFKKANKWADNYLSQIKEYEIHPKALND